MRAVRRERRTPATQACCCTSGACRSIVQKRQVHRVADWLTPLDLIRVCGGIMFGSDAILICVNKYTTTRSCAYMGVKFWGAHTR
jgi:hypothetical protein